MSLKSLFGNLIKNYGDDTLKFAANKGDDALRVLDKIDDFDNTAYFKSLEASMPEFDYGAHLAQVDSDSALRDAMFDRLSNQNKFRFKMNSIDNTLLNGGRLETVTDAPEYLRALVSPTKVWKTSTPLKQNDARLDNLYAQLKDRLRVANDFESKYKRYPYKYPSRELLNESLQEVDRIKQILQVPTQLELEF